MRGFTLFELMIIVSIALIVGLLAAPSFSHWMGRSHAQAVTSEVLHYLNSARVLALQTGRRASFCGLDDQGRCTRTGIDDIVVFIDANRNQVVDAEDTVHSRARLGYNGQIALEASKTNHISFDADGSTVTFGSLYFCARNNAPELSRRVTVSRPGRAYVALPGKRSGLVRRTDQSPIVCPLY